jgi:hypothetical protein
MEIQARHSALVAQLLKEDDPSNEPLFEYITRLLFARGNANQLISIEEYFTAEARRYILNLSPFFKNGRHLTFSLWKEYYNPNFGATLPFCMTQWITFEYMGRLYKELLPAETDRDGFLDAFRWMPSVAGDVVDLLRSRAWERRRHLLACW